MLMLISMSLCCASNAELFVQMFIRLSREAGFVYCSGVHFVSLVSACVCVLLVILLLHRRLKELDTFKTCITVRWDAQFLIFLSFLSFKSAGSYS
jgi:hypothetical protein